MPKTNPNTTEVRAAFSEFIKKNHNDDAKLSEFLNAQPSVVDALGVDDFTMYTSRQEDKDTFIKNICRVMDQSPEALDHILDLIFLRQFIGEHYFDDYKNLTQNRSLIQPVAIARFIPFLPRYQSAIINGAEGWEKKLSLLKNAAPFSEKISDVYKVCVSHHVARLLRVLKDELSDDKSAVLKELYSYRTDFSEIDKNVSDYYLKKFSRMKLSALSCPGKNHALMKELKLIQRSSSEYWGYCEAQFVLGEYYYERKMYKEAEEHFSNVKDIKKDAHAYLGHIMEMGKSRSKKDLFMVLESYFQAMPHPLAEERLRALSMVSSKKQLNVKCLALLYLGLSQPEQSDSLFEQAYAVDSATYISFVSDKLDVLNADVFSKLRLLRHAVDRKESGEVRFSKQLFTTLFMWLINPGAQSANELSVKLKDYLSANLYAKFSLILSDHFELPVALRAAVLEQAQTYSPKHMRAEVTKALLQYRPEIISSASGATSQVGMFATPPADVPRKKRSDKASASVSQSRGC